MQINMLKICRKYAENMQKICRIICKIRRKCTKICYVKDMHKICEKYAEYALTYAKYVKYTGKCDMQRICTKMCKIRKICEQKCDTQNMHSPPLFKFADEALQCLGSESRSAKDIMTVTARRSAELQLERRASIMKEQPRARATRRKRAINLNTFDTRHRNLKIVISSLRVSPITASAAADRHRTVTVQPENQLP